MIIWFIYQFPSRMLNIKQINELSSSIQSISQQNEADLSVFADNYSLDEPLHKFIFEKMQLLQDIINIASNAINCVSDLKQQKDSFQSTNHNLRQDLNRMFDLNQNLENQIQELIAQVNLQKEQIEEGCKKQLKLEKEESRIRKQLQYTKSKLQQNQQKQRKNLQAQPFQQDNKENERNRINESIHSVQKQLNQLRQTTNIVRRKMSQEQKKTKMALRPTKSINSFNYLSSAVPKNLLQSKLATNSQILIKNSKNSIVNSSNFAPPTKLNESLKELNLISFNSIVEEYKPYQFNQPTNYRQSHENSQLQFDPNERKSNKLSQLIVNPERENHQTDNILSQSINSVDKKSQISHHWTQNQRTPGVRFSKKDSALSNISQIHKFEKNKPTHKQCCNKLPTKFEYDKADCLCKKIFSALFKTHQFFYNKIVKERIEPRRTINKLKKLNQLKKKGN